MTVKDILDRVTEELQVDAPTDKRKIKDWIYDCEKDMVRQHDFSTLSFKTVIEGNGSSVYPLPTIFGREVFDQPVIHNNEPIANINSNVFNNPNYEILDYLTFGTQVTVNCPGNPDPDKVIIYDKLNNQQETLELQGATNVTTTATFDQVSHINKEATTNPLVLQTPGGDVYLPRGAGTYTIKSIKFRTRTGEDKEWATGEDVDLKFIKQIRKLEEDTDLDELTGEYGDVIGFYCLYRGFINQEDDIRAGKMLELYISELKKIIVEDRRKKKISNTYTFIPREVG